MKDHQDARRRVDDDDQQEENSIRLDDLAKRFLPEKALKALDRDVLIRLSSKGGDGFEVELRIPAALILFGMVLAHYFPLKM